MIDGGPKGVPAGPLAVRGRIAHDDGEKTDEGGTCTFVTDRLLTHEGGHMVSDVGRRRFGALFLSLDRDGNGFVDGNDHELVVASIAQQRNLTPGSPEHDDLRAKVMHGWEGLRELADTDGDGRVTQEEYVESLAALAESPEGLDRIGLSIADQMITAMDADGDGRLDLDEFMSMAGAWGAAAEKAEALFRHIDTNGDGFLTRDELLASMRRFFLDEDPDAPHLFG